MGHTCGVLMVVCCAAFYSMLIYTLPEWQETALLFAGCSARSADCSLTPAQTRCYSKADTARLLQQGYHPRQGYLQVGHIRKRKQAITKHIATQLVPQGEAQKSTDTANRWAEASEH